MVVTKVDQVKISGSKSEDSEISNNDSVVSENYFSCEGCTIDTDDLTRLEDGLDMDTFGKDTVQ